MTSSMSADDLDCLAQDHGVPRLDTMMIAANAEGTRSTFDFPRTRMQLRPLASEEVWQLILPLNSEQSPFELDGEVLSLHGEPVARVVAMENDDVVLTYIRAGGRSLTLNSHSRSTCTGCAFCPNVIEDAADGNVNGVDELDQLLTWVEADNEWGSLEGVEVITVCSGCFRTAEAAIRHMADLRTAASRHSFTGRLHLLSSVVRRRDDLVRLAAEAGPFHLTVTLECFTRRDLLLKSTKASLTLDEICRILDDCGDLGVLGDFTYVSGLDPIADAVAGLRRLARHVTSFPRIQVYQAHNDYMRHIRAPEAESLAYQLRLRNEIEGAYAGRGLAPRSWENYRPLWYSTFAGRPVEGPRV